MMSTAQHVQYESHTHPLRTDGRSDDRSAHEHGGDVDQERQRGQHLETATPVSLDTHT